MNETEKRRTLPYIPMKELLSSTAQSVVQAQEKMNTVSLNEEIQLRRQDMHKHGFRAQWYTIPEVDLNIKMAMDINQNGEVQTQLIDGSYQQKYGFNIACASTLSAQIKAVPSESLTGISLHDKNEIVAKFGDFKEIVERYEVCNNPELVIWFQGNSNQGYSGGLWYILLTDTDANDEIIIHATAVIDDQSGEFVQYNLRKYFE